MSSSPIPSAAPLYAIPLVRGESITFACLWNLWIEEFRVHGDGGALSHPAYKSSGSRRGNFLHSLLSKTFCNVPMTSISGPSHSLNFSSKQCECEGKICRLVNRYMHVSTYRESRFYASFIQSRRAQSA
jgi:hypothetical protein